MKTLFGKILLWFVATAALAVIGFAVISALVHAEMEQGHEPVRQALRFHGGEAIHAYEEGGSAALVEFLRRMETAYGFQGVLTDEKGRSLAGHGEDFSSLVGRGRRRPFFDLSRRALVFTTDVEGREGRYWFVLLLPRQRFGFWARMRQSLLLPHVAVVGSVLLLSYALARHLTRPVQELRAAAERLGRGEYHARVGSKRKDELGELARTFDQMAEQVEHAVASQRQLLQDVSHELRSPLSRLAVAVELARSSPDPGPVLDRVCREADRLNALVGELLAISRDQVRLAPVDVSGLLAGLVDEIRIEAEARGCRILLEVPAGIELKADLELLRRAIENVVRNGVRYTEPGTEVRVTAAIRGSDAEIAVEDAGPGVPDEAIPRLFDPFYRVDRDRDRATGGVGLGLSIAKRAVELHGGTIRAENIRPGLRVAIRLPGAIMKA